MIMMVKILSMTKIFMFIFKERKEESSPLDDMPNFPKCFIHYLSNITPTLSIANPSSHSGLEFFLLELLIEMHAFLNAKTTNHIINLPNYSLIAPKIQIERLNTQTTKHLHAIPHMRYQ